VWLNQTGRSGEDFVRWIAEPHVSKQEAESDESDEIHGLGIAGGDRGVGWIVDLEPEATCQLSRVRTAGGLLRGRA
jgi:hypothetical protein